MGNSENLGSLDKKGGLQFQKFIFMQFMFRLKHQEGIDCARHSYDSEYSNAAMLNYSSV